MMESVTGTPLEQTAGIGTRTDQESGTTAPWPEFLPSYVRDVIRCFEDLPIVESFGISFTEAMKLPVDRWYRIRDAATRIKNNKPPVRDTEGEMLEILKLFLVSRSEES